MNEKEAPSMMPMADSTLAAAIGWSLVGWGPSSMAAILMAGSLLTATALSQWSPNRSSNSEIGND